MLIPAGSTVSVMDSAGAWIVVGITTTTDDLCCDCGWPRGLCTCIKPVTADELERLLACHAVPLVEPSVPGWRRLFQRDRRRAPAGQRPPVARIWRRLHGRDVGQARRQKRRRFVQRLAKGAATT